MEFPPTKKLNSVHQSITNLGEYIMLLSKLGEGRKEFKKEFYTYLQPIDEEKRREKSAIKIMDEIKESFERMDLDHNGFLSKDELKQGYSNGNFEISDEGVDFILENVDNDGDGNVNLGEYVLFLSALGDEGAEFSTLGEEGAKFRKDFLRYLNRK